jgi:hypothetical protein
MAAVVAARVSCRREPYASLAILEQPQRNIWADSGVSQVTRGQGHRSKWVGYLTGAINIDPVLKALTPGETRASSVNSERVVTYDFARFYSVRILPGVDK